MKKIYLILSIITSIAAVSSCLSDEEFLTEKPKTIYTAENAFEKTTQVDAQIGRAYSAFYRLHSWGTDVWEELPAFIGGGGGSASTLLAGYGSDVHDEDGSLAHASSSFSMLNMINPLYSRFLSLWNQLYQLNAYSNLALYGIETVDWKGDDAAKAAATAQAKFFIGWANLRLAECFGDVPLVKEYDSSLRYDYVRDPRKDVYQYAIDNFIAAAEGLPENAPQQGRLTKSAAYHYLTEAYLALGVETADSKCYTEAVKYADMVIEKHPLMTKRFGVRANPEDDRKWKVNGNEVAYYRPDGNVFYDMFQIGNYNTEEGNTEAVLVLQSPTYAEQSENGGLIFNLGNACGQSYKDNTWKDKEIGEGRQSPWTGNIDMTKYPEGEFCAYLGGQTWGMYGSTDYVDEFVWQGEFADDIRNAQINLCDPVVLDQNHSKHGQIVKKEWLGEPSRHMRVSAKIKMQDDWGWDEHQGQPYSTQYGRDWYAARSAETYLLKAEAQLRGGDADAAAATMNVVRTRAQAKKMLSGSEVDIYMILQERTRELSWEEHRWPTLLRMGQTGKDNEVMHHQILNHAMYIHDLPMYQGDIKWSLFPIPQSIIQMNVDAPMEQNPGWN